MRKASAATRSHPRRCRTWTARFPVVGLSLGRNFNLLSEPIDGLLRKRGSTEDRPFVGFQDVKPGGDIRCMVRSRLERDAKIGTEECSADFRDEFFASVSVIGEALTEVAIAAMRG
jgi:hypothetical protein